MTNVRSAQRRRTRKGHYHHGDLARALREEAVRLIARRGLGAVTVREVGAQLGVSRAALYRHYPDKQALLAAVAAEGFVLLRRALIDAWSVGPPSLDRFTAMGEAYVGFAAAHPAHYRVMFGGHVTNDEICAEIDGESTDAFAALMDAIVALQSSKLARQDNSLAMALYVWSVVHGVAMLALDGLLPNGMSAPKLMAYANLRIRAGVAA